jgi:inositol phosphorylceramide mannosyltransferase catalytic subunit
MNANIPKRIIQTGKSRDLPLLSKAVVWNIKSLNPNFEYLFFDDPIQRYDFFRYLAIYHFGGFYFDLDVLLSSSLEDLLDSGCVFPFEELTIHSFLRQQYGMDWEIGNYAFGAKPRHPFIEAIIENCVRAQEEPKWAEQMFRRIPRVFRKEFFVVDTTGPGLISRTLAEYPDAVKDVRVLFPENCCDPGSWHCFGSYGVHLQEGGWRSRKNLVARRLASVWESWTRSRLLGESLRLGGTRSLSFKKPA